jgi:hypothetical protein
VPKPFPSIVFVYGNGFEGDGVSMPLQPETLNANIYYPLAIAFQLLIHESEKKELHHACCVLPT